MSLSMLRIVENRGGSQGSYQGGPRPLGACKYILFIFSLSSNFLRNVSCPSGHSQLRLYTRDKQLVHLKSF